MTILYKKTDGVLHYWKTWKKDKRTSVIYSGQVGQYGAIKKVKSGYLFSFKKKNIKNEISLKFSQGYQQTKNYQIIHFIFNFKEIDSRYIFKKKKELEEKLYEILYLNGLGYSGYAYMINGSMEINCYVIDQNIAETIIKQNLENSVFANCKIKKIEGTNKPIRMNICNLFIKMNLKSYLLNNIIHLN